MQFRHAARHRTRVPVLKDTARAEVEVVLRIGHFHRSRVRTEEDLGAARQRFRRLIGDAVEVTLRNRLHEFAVELEVAGLHKRVVLGVEAVSGFLAVNNRPGETAHLRIHVGVKVREVMAVAQGELTVFGEKRFFREPGDAQGFGGAVSLIRVLRIRPRAVLHGLHAGVQHVVERGIRAVPHGLGAFENVRKRLLARLLFLPAFADFEALGKLHHHPDVASGFTRRQHHLMPPLRAAFGVAVKAPFFKDHRDRQNQVGDLG